MNKMNKNFDFQKYYETYKISKSLPSGYSTVYQNSKGKRVTQ